MSNYFSKMFSEKTFFVAEIGGNFSDVETGKKLIDLAIESHADAVKIQTYKAATLSSRKAAFSSDGMPYTGDKSQFEQFSKYQIDDTVQQELFQYAESNQVLLFSTPSHYSDCLILEKLCCPIYKIGSDDLSNLAFLKEVAGLGKPMIVSTGMSTLNEIADAVNAILGQGNSDVCLLHCVTNYPAEYKNANLSAISTMIEHFFPIPIGFSDHASDDELVPAAVALGAALIEKHFTYDKKAEGPDHPMSLLPHEFKQMVEKVRRIEDALGDGIKKPALSELTTRRNNRKSIVMTKRLEAGDPLTRDSFEIKRPGWGIAPIHADSLPGRVLARTIEEDDVLTWDYFRS